MSGSAPVTVLLCLFATFTKVDNFQGSCLFLLKNEALPKEGLLLTLKVPNKNCSSQHFIFFTFFLSMEIRLDVSCESSA